MATENITVEIPSLREKFRAVRTLGAHPQNYDANWTDATNWTEKYDDAVLDGQLKMKVDGWPSFKIEKEFYRADTGT